MLTHCLCHRIPRDLLSYLPWCLFKCYFLALLAPRTITTHAGRQGADARRALQLLVTPVTLRGLVANRLSAATHGTSPNEAFHGSLRRFLQNCGGNRTFKLLSIALDVIVYKYNGRLPLLLQLASVKII
jgi:hypothetical protein